MQFGGQYLVGVLQLDALVHPLGPAALRVTAVLERPPLLLEPRNFLLGDALQPLVEVAHRKLQQQRVVDQVVRGRATAAGIRAASAAAAPGTGGRQDAAAGHAQRPVMILEREHPVGSRAHRELRFELADAVVVFSAVVDDAVGRARAQQRLEGLPTERRYLLVAAVDRRTVVIAVARLYHGRVLVLHHVPLCQIRLPLLLLLLFFVLSLILLLLLVLLLLLMVVVVMVMVVRVLLLLLLLVLMMLLLHFIGTRVVWSQVQWFLSLAQRLRQPYHLLHKHRRLDRRGRRRRRAHRRRVGRRARRARIHHGTDGRGVGSGHLDRGLASGYQHGAGGHRGRGHRVALHHHTGARAVHTAVDHLVDGVLLSDERVVVRIFLFATGRREQEVRRRRRLHQRRGGCRRGRGRGPVIGARDGHRRQTGVDAGGTPWATITGGRVLRLLLLLMVLIVVVMVMSARVLLMRLLMVMVVIVGRLDLALHRRHVQMVEHELVDVFVGQTWIVSFHFDACAAGKTQIDRKR